MTTALPTLKTAKEAADFLGVRTGTLEQWRWLGKGPKFIKVGARVMYSDEQLREYIEARTRTSSALPA